MIPSLFSTAVPVTAFQVWFVVYLYLLPLMLYAAWTALSLMDFLERRQDDASPYALLAVMLLPLAGGAWYVLRRARTLSLSARVAIVVGGAAVWLVPLISAVWLVGRPLGPKALS